MASTTEKKKRKRKKHSEQSWSSQFNGNFPCEFFRSQTELQNPNSAKNIISWYALGDLIHFGFN